MNTELQALDTLFESVADGSRINWPALEKAAVSDTQRRLVLQLSIVAGVAEAYGTQGDEGTADEPGSSAELPSFAGPVKRWGHLVLLEKIGEGHYAEVYRGRDVWLDTDVAVKLLKPQPGEDPSAFRLRDEARALARVRHENVVSVQGAAVYEGCPGLWMEFVHGRTLHELLVARGPFGAADAARIGRQLCAALSAVHDAGVVHGDIKAQNVMQEPGGRVVLVDFGASQLADGRLRGPAPAGTPLCLAPEVLNSGETTIRSDIYAVGVLLYHLVTCTYPVNASSLEGLMAAHVTGEHRTLRDARPDFPAGFVAVVDRALEQNPDDRFPTARAMEEALASPRRRTRKTSPNRGTIDERPVPAVQIRDRSCGVYLNR
jgi:serine/threonine-protein kinase